MSREIEELKLIERLKDNCLFKLRVNCNKDHWNKTELIVLCNYLLKEVTEIQQAIIDEESPESVWLEAGDIANFAAMIADTYEYISEI